MKTANKQWKVSEAKITYINRIKASDRVKITCSIDAANIFRDTWDKDTMDMEEQFKCMYLNAANQILSVITISTGGIKAVLVDPQKVFCGAIKCFASGIILCHNHPSGKLKPSDQDKQLTNRMKHAGEVLGIKVLDHLIIGRKGCYSFADEGIL